MRLTVRTLLAWIDGVLAPEDQQDLGEKVAASGVAPQLVERTKAVVEHAALAAASPEGRGLADDPNTAAEFLDNVLANDRLEAFERVCIESDIHLAEVAACHRLLAEIARDPHVVAVPGSRERKRLLDAVTKQLPIGRGPFEISDAARAAGSSARKPSSEPGRRRRRAPVTAWIAAAAAATLLAVLTGFLVWSLVRSGRGPRDVAGGERAAPAATEKPIDDQNAPQQPATIAPPVAAGEPSNAPPAEMPPPPAVARAPAPEPPAEPPAENGVEIRSETQAESRPANPVTTPPAEDRRIPTGDALAIVAAPPAAGDPALASAPSAAPGPAMSGESHPATELADTAAEGATVVGDGGPLLHRVEGDGGPRWCGVTPGGVLAAREDLLSPPWCYPTLSIDGITIRLHPNTRAVLARDASGVPRLEVVFGRAVVSGAAADAAVGVIAGGLCGELSGMLRQPAGIEVVLGRAAGEPPRRWAAVHAGSAEKVWRQTTSAGAAADEPLVGIAPESVLAARTTLTWDDRDPGGAAVGPPAAEPAWLRATATDDRTQRAAVRGLAAAVATAGDVGVEQPLHAMAANSRAEDRMMAAATLALVGDYGALVALLCDDTQGGMLKESQWTMLEAVTVPLAIARGDNATAKLGEAFRTHGPAGKGDALLTLARGFSDHDLAAGGDQFLVDSLDDGSLAVRRYASRRLIEIVQPDERHRTDYRADRPAGLRRDGIAWWRAQLEQGRIRRGPLPAESTPPAASAAGQRDDE